MKVTARERKLWLIVLTAAIAALLWRFVFHDGASFVKAKPAAFSMRQAQRLLQSEKDIIARHQAVAQRLKELRKRFLARAGAAETQLALLDQVEDLALASDLQVTRKDLVNLADGLTGVLLEGTASAEALFRMLHRVATVRAGLMVKRLQVHGNREIRDLKYQIIVASKLLPGQSSP
jgi:hypothetical protein